MGWEGRSWIGGEVGGAAARLGSAIREEVEFVTGMGCGML